MEYAFQRLSSETPGAQGERTLLTRLSTLRARTPFGRVRAGASVGLFALLWWLLPGQAAAFERSGQGGVGAVKPGSSAAKTVEPGIREALQAYEDALESLDADAVKKIQPSIDVEGLKRAFREMRSLEVAIDEIRLLSGDQASARVSCRVAQTLTPRAGSRQTTTVTRVLRLRRESSGWVIQSFER